ncbi:MAG: transposase [Elusimicrobia bacterium]|nr:transposase [Elusimicrobiota bacterium]
MTLNQARRAGIGDGYTSTLTVIQRFGGGLNLNVHFHTLVLDGVFAETETGSLRFYQAPPPSDEEVARLLTTIRARVRRLLHRHGLADDADLTPPDPLAEESLALAGISAASVQGRIALGRRAGARVWRLGHDPEAPWVASIGPRQAHLDGFDLHANRCVSATDRARLERLCRYLLRPPVAQDRLRLTGDGHSLLKLKNQWADGTGHLLFEPLELLEKLAALTPRPRVNLVLYHGVLAPHACWRHRAVAYEDSGSLRETPAAESEARGVSEVQNGDSGKPRYWAWADLMRRAFDLDVLACPRCGGRMRLIATIEDPAVIRRLLDHLGLPTGPSDPCPSRPPPGRVADLFSDIPA